ncbi:NEL-type E3 ubiquitin ligase domain-containing protein [Pseudomonas canadensis]|uniref:NEL-type E3 ubiquitin ligase domain-containing protein n=1 Tax=Pseudomonas canadensis TaxID=915099 RepID=UPI003BA0FF8F
MSAQDDLTHVFTQLTQQQLQSALLEMTADLDKAQVLQKKMPGWMINAPDSVLAALERDAALVEVPKAEFARLLARLQPLDAFCEAHLTAYCKTNWNITVRPKKDTFIVAIPNYHTEQMPLGYVKTFTLEHQSLLQRAMQNFSLSEARVGNFSPESMLHSTVTGRLAITPQTFVEGCRSLDLGRLYQQHISDVFNLPPPGTDDTFRVNTAAVDIGRMKTLDMKIDAHIALIRADITPDAHGVVCTLLDRNLAPDNARDVLFKGRPVMWQGLNARDSCLWGIVVFSGRPVADYPMEPCLVYMPNEPVRPFFEYPTFKDYVTYLDLKLEVATYRTFFTRYLGEVDRLSFFRAFDQHRTLGAIEGMPIRGSLASHFFSTCVGKLQIDARTLAVPTVDVDEQERTQRRLAYLDAGLTVLNLAAFVVPALGILMTGVAVGQIVSQVFEGIEDWRRNDREEALMQLGAVAQSLTSMALFAAGVKVVSPMWRRARLSFDQFFGALEPVESSDGSPRLWRPNFSSYGHDQALVEGVEPDAQGFYPVNDGACIKINGFVHRVVYDAKLGQWRAVHPTRQAAYRPTLLHNGEGAWRFTLEHPEEWEDPQHVFSRLEPRSHQPVLDSRKLQMVSAIMDKPYGWGSYLAQECLPLPARFRDLFECFKLDQSIRDLIWQLERGVYLNAETATLQMQALPLLPEWPRARFFECLDAEGNVTARYPEATSVDAVQRLTVTEHNLKAGQVFDVVLSAMDDTQKRALLGDGVAHDQEHAVLVSRLLAHLKADRRPLFERAYLAYDRSIPQVSEPLAKAWPQLPRTLMRELVAELSTVELEILRTHQRIPMALAESVRNALEELRLDRALAGFQLPELAGVDSQSVAVRLLPRLPGWDKALHLELRQDSLTGDLLALGALEGASQRRVVVKTAAGFQPFDANGLSMADVQSGPDGLFSAIERALHDKQRADLGLLLLRTDNEWRLRRKVADLAEGERAVAAEAFAPTAHEPLVVEQACVMGDSPVGLEVHPAALVRKLKRIYPSFTDAQASVFLTESGVDYLARAKTVKRLEEQWAQLRGILKRWRSHTQDMTKLPGDLRDIRQSRQEVARRIEACWRRQSFVLDERQASVAGLTLDGMRIGTLPIVPAHIRFDHVRQLSLNNMRLGDDVAYYLKLFKGLRRLELGRNNLTRLPEVFSLMPDLESLSLPHNQLQLSEYTRLKLAGMVTLRRLDLSHNPLQVGLDVTRMQGLHTLLLQDTRTVDVPVGLERLAFLDQVDLRDNWITVLPDWLYTASRNYSQALNLGGNSLSPATVTALTRYREAVGIGMGYLGDDPPRLTELKARALWLPDEVADRDENKRSIWSSLRDDPESEPLFVLLAELAGTADSRHVREDLTRRVWEVLQSTHESVALREQVFQLSAHPVNCGDGAAHIFSQLEVLMEIEKATRLAGRTQASPAVLLRLGRGLFRLSELEKLAAMYAAEHPDLEPLEVSLAYRSGLADVLALPGQPKYLRYGALISQGVLDTAHQQVLSAEMFPAFLRFLAQLSFWRAHLKQQFPHSFSAATQPFEVRQQALFENSQNLTDGDYLQQMEALCSPRRRAVNAVVERLTLQLMRNQDLGICHVPELR